MRIRFIASLGQIQRARLEIMDGLESLSTDETLEAYELERFKSLVAKGRPIPGEQKRAQRAVKLLKQHLIVLDMTGINKENKNDTAGKGYVTDIANMLDREMQQRGKGAYVAAIYIDYVGAFARRHQALTNKSEDALRHLIQQAPILCKAQLAVPYSCPVWLVHQLSGDANKRPPWSNWHYTDSAECRSFAENLDFCFVVGTMTSDGKARLFNSKHRRRPDMEPRVVQLEGSYGLVKDVSESFVADASLRGIVARNIADTVAKTTSDAASRVAKNEANPMIVSPLGDAEPDEAEEVWDQTLLDAEAEEVTADETP